MVNDSAEQMQRLGEEFKKNLPQKAQQISELWKHLRYQKWTDRGFKSLQNLVHRLAGSGSSFGLSQISHCASQLDEYLREQSSQHAPQLAIDFEYADHLIQVLTAKLNDTENRNQTKAEATPFCSDEPGKDSTPKKLIFLIDNDHPLCALTTIYLRSASYNVQHFEKLQDCLVQMDLQIPDAVLIDPEIIDDTAFETISDLKSRLPQSVPVMVISARSDLYARLKALRCGSECFMTKPLDYDALIQSLNRIIRNNEISYRVMIVDDEPLVAEHHAAILKHAGMETLCVTNPMQSLQIAHDFLPDLVLLDMHMPNINGIELAKLLRQDEKFLLTPMIFITADTSSKLHQSIESLGVNGLLTKPVDMASLINVSKRAINDTFSLKQRIERVTQKATYANQITRSYFFGAVEQELLEYNAYSSAGEFAAIYYIGFKIPDDVQTKINSTDLLNLRAQFSQRLASHVTHHEPWADLSNMIACVLAGKKSADAHQERASELQDLLSERPFILHDKPLKLEAYIGGCQLTDKLTSAKVALDLAERAFDQAFFQYQEGNFSIQSANHAPTQSSTSEHNKTQDKIDSDLETPATHFATSLPLDNLGLCYQPMISFEHSEVTHYEALVRWRSAEHDLIPAATFLKYVQHSAMRIELDRWVLQTAITALTNDRYARENVSLFIHLANETLSQNTFFSFAANVIHTSRLRGEGRLIFIFEESWVKEHLDMAVSVFVALRNIRCCICLSHAGSTDQTLPILQKMAFDYVRIQPELTTSLENDAEKKLRLKQIVQQAKASGSQIIATQVEDSKNLSTLWLKGVRLFQGFVLQAPEQTFRTQDEQDILKNFAMTRAH